MDHQIKYNIEIYVYNSLFSPVLKQNKLLNILLFYNFCLVIVMSFETRSRPNSEN